MLYLTLKLFSVGLYLAYSPLSKKVRPVLVAEKSAPVWTVRNLGNNIITLAQQDGRRLVYYKTCESESLIFSVDWLTWELITVNKGAKTFRINAVVGTLTSYCYIDSCILLISITVF